MKPQIPSNPKIKCTLLSILFSILFIFTALYFTEPLVIHASQLGQTRNLSEYSSNETDESSNERAGYLYWAASGDRSGIYYYVIDDTGWIRAHGIIMDDAGKAQYGDYDLDCTSGRIVNVKPCA